MLTATRMLPPLAVAALPIAYVNAVAALSNTATMPAHAVGDLMIVSASSASATVPTLGTGYTTRGTPIAITPGTRLGERIATATNDAFQTWTNAGNVIAGIYRNSGGIGAVASQTGTSATITFPALTLQVNDGTSWVVRISYSTATNHDTATLPAGYTTRRASTVRSTLCDSNGPVAGNPTSAAMTVNASSAFVAWTIEIRMPRVVAGAFNETNLTGDFLTPSFPGMTGCYYTGIGAGGGGSNSISSGTGSGGGGGGRIDRIFIPLASLGSSYATSRSLGASNVTGGNSTFVSGSVTLQATGGTKGVASTGTPAGGAGGVPTASGVSPTLRNGSAGGAGGGSGANNGVAGSANAVGAGAGGGGGGGFNFSNRTGGSGGSSATVTGPTGIAGAGVAATDAASGEGGAGGAGGGGQNVGGAGGDFGGGGGGAGTNSGISAGGAGGDGWSLIEWV